VIVYLEFIFEFLLQFDFEFLLHLVIQYTIFKDSKVYVGGGGGGGVSWCGQQDLNRLVLCVAFPEPLPRDDLP
jgi:hypothetical protein